MTLQISLIIMTIISAVNFTKTELTGFIVGGYISNIKDFPHSVYVSISCSERNTSCGASILNQALLLTAAHCVYKCKNKNNFTINAYTGSRHKYKGFENNVVSFRIHKEYNTNSKANDIALLKLGSDLKFGPKVKRVALMKKPPKYNDALVAGWGWIDSKGTKINDLKHTSQQIYNWRECMEILKIIPNGTICGRELDGISYPERGDSGSALVVHNIIQIGIVSFKKRGYTNDTIVYTDVPYYYDWIKKNAAEMYCRDQKEKTLREKPKGRKAVEKKDRKQMWKDRLGASWIFI